MPAVDLSQLPEPAIIAEPDFEAILADTKAMMIASYPAEQREAVSAALELESEPLNVIAQTMSFREMLLRQRVMRVHAPDVKPRPGQTWTTSQAI
ncbi:baseplate J-like family protein [Escherichia coli P0304777.11]|nr:baseplate J-like family protein [Escherichia coli P0304777.11]